MVSLVGVDIERARSIVESIVDPEIPVLSIAELGVLREVAVEGATVVVTITPTYSGCPAMRQIENDITDSLEAKGFEAKVVVRQNPAWTTDWMSEDARRKLDEFGIAPPTAAHEVVCPTCRADAPTTVSLFGSTACKALMVCSSCGEPFDYFKRY